ncbi:MAG: restriction endonuclease subunit S [Methanobacterium sp.]
MNNELSDLKNINWGEFKIEDIFNIERSKVHDKINLKETHRGIAHISRTNLDNGLNCIVVNENFEHNPKNTIVFGAENANFFFQPFNYITGDKMYVITNEKFNKYNSLFIKLMLEYSIKHSGFGYGKGLTGNRLKRMSILLPITESRLPDWNFMEFYIKTKEKSLLREYKSYLDEKLLLIQDRKKYLISKDEFFTKNVKWGTFILSEIFEIESTSSGIDKNKLINTKGTIPYITRTDENNGCADFIGKQDEKYIKNKGNVITIGLDTQTVFYQVSEFYTGQNIQIVYNNKLNKYNALFIIPLLKKLMKKFNWGGNGATLTRLKKSRIRLPIDSKKNPDWDFMESYMKNLEYEKINMDLNYIEKKLND